MTETESAAANIQRWLGRRIDLKCRSGFGSLEGIIGNIEDQVPNNVDEDVGDDEVAAVVAALTATAEASFKAHAADEATWTERTLTDRIDDVLANLEANGMIARKSTYWREQADDLFGASEDPNDPWEEKPDPRWLFALTLREDEAGVIVATARIQDLKSRTTREEDLKKNGEEFMRVLRHHGFSASWNAQALEVAVDAFRFQKRRASKAPAGAKPATPRPDPAAPCARCGGKGWITSDPTQFPERCACKTSGGIKPG